MKNYKIIVQYDGTRYKGWQVLKSEENTIQGKLQRVLESLVGYPVEVIGSGRTDAGVHSMGQTANFHIEEQIVAAELKKRNFTNLQQYLNNYLPDDIAVVSLQEIDDRFHARFNAVQKTYRYRIHVSDIPDVFERRFQYTYLDVPLDVKKMKQAAALFLGEHDFQSVCGNKKMKKSTVRTIYSIDIREIKDEKTGMVKEIQLDYTGDGFLQNMIRIITGTLIEVGCGRRAADSISLLLASKDRSQAGYTVPAQGLILMEVNY